MGQPRPVSRRSAPVRLAISSGTCCFQRQHGFHGEFRQGLQPRQDRQGEALGDEELRRFGGPGDQHGGGQNARRGPQDRRRAGHRNGTGGRRSSSAQTGAIDLLALIGRLMPSCLLDDRVPGEFRGAFPENRYGSARRGSLRAPGRSGRSRARPARCSASKRPTLAFEPAAGLAGGCLAIAHDPAVFPESTAGGGIRRDALAV